MSGRGALRGTTAAVGRPPPPSPPSLRRARDPIFALAEPLRPEEEGTHSRKPVAPPQGTEPAAAPRDEPPARPGGWLGRGCAKGTRRRKSN